MEIPKPVLFDYFPAWDPASQEAWKPFYVEQSLINHGQWESAWAFAQLHYDQHLKQEAKANKRLHKGAPLCSLALAGREIRSPSLLRHYACISSAGDIYIEHEKPELAYGGYAPTMLEQFESRDKQNEFRDRVRTDLAEFRNSGGVYLPAYLEAFLACRWFSEAMAQHVIELASMDARDGKPFVEVLLDSIERPPVGALDDATGTRFEAATGMLLSATPGFEVLPARKQSDEQVDLTVNYSPEAWAPIGLDAGRGLVECKSSRAKVTAKELRDFGAKCLFHRVKFGILIARAGTTGSPDIFENHHGAELTRRRFLLDGLTLLVLDITQLRGKSRELRVLRDALFADHELLVFGPQA
jgi:hypothetical protein